MEPPREIPPVSGTPAVPRAGKLSRRVPQSKMGAGAPDRVALSSQAQELLAIRRRIDEAPEIRASLVDRLVREVREGRYRPSAAEIARRLVAVLRRREG